MKNRFKILSTSLIVALSFASSQASYAMNESDQGTSKSLTISQNKAKDDDFENIQVHYVKHPWEENIYQEDVIYDQLEKELKKSRLYKQYDITEEQDKKDFDTFFDSSVILTHPYTKETIEFRVSDLPDPMDGEFKVPNIAYLSMDPMDRELKVPENEYLSINTGYKKGIKKENAGKLEVWLVLRFMAKRAYDTSGWKRFRNSFAYSHWLRSAAPLAIVWTDGNSNNLEDYEILKTENLVQLSNGEKLSTKHMHSRHCSNNGNRCFDKFWTHHCEMNNFIYKVK